MFYKGVVVPNKEKGVSFGKRAREGEELGREGGRRVLPNHPRGRRKSLFYYFFLPPLLLSGFFE